MRLLLATAEPNLRFSLDLLLSEQPGVAIVGSASESEGLLALVLTTKADMVFSDWDLPGRPLPEILPEMAKATQPPQIIILVTHSSDSPAALSAGADAVVIKGASPDLLLMNFQRLRTQSSHKQEH